MQIEIELTPAQEKALAFGVVDYVEMVQSMTIGRADVLVDEIVAAEVQRKLAAGEPITGTKEDIVMAADVETAAQRLARHEAELEAARITAEQAAE